MDRETLVRRQVDVVARQIQGDLVAIAPSLRNYVALDDVGQSIWAMLAAPIQVGALIDQLQSSFQGDAAEIEADVLEFLGELEREDLLAQVGSTDAQAGR